MYRKILAIIIMVTMFIGQSLPGFALQSLRITTSKGLYDMNETIEIEGSVYTTNNDRPVTIVLKNWGATAVYYIDEVKADHNGDFNLKVSSHGMDEGEYYITARHGGMMDEASFSISDGASQVERQIACQVNDKVTVGDAIVINGHIREDDLPVVGLVTVKVTDEQGDVIYYVDEITSKFDGTYQSQIGTENFDAGEVILKLVFGQSVLEKTIKAEEKVEYVLDLDDLSETYYEGESINIKGQTYLNGQGIRGSVSLYVDDLLYSDYRTNSDGAFDLNLSTNNLGLGTHTLSVLYGDVYKGIDIEVIKNDYSLKASTTKSTYYESETVIVEGQISTNGRPVTEDVWLALDGTFLEYVTAQKGVIELFRPAHEYGVGDHELTLDRRGQTVKVDFKVIKDVYESQMDISSDAIDYGQGITVFGTVKKNHNPFDDALLIEVYKDNSEDQNEDTINENRYKESLYKETIRSDQAGRYSIDIPASIFKTDGNYEIRLTHRDEIKVRTLKVNPVFALETQDILETYKLGESILISGQVSKNTQPFKGQVTLTFDQGETHKTQTLVADEEGRFTYKLTTLDWNEGDLRVTATYEGESADLKSRLVSHTYLSLDALESTYMHGETLVLTGQGEKDGKPLTSTLSLRVYDKTGSLVKEGQIELSEDGTFVHSFNTSGIEEGPVIFEVAYGDEVITVSSEILYDFDLFVKPLKETYKLGQKIDIKGHTIINGEKSKASLVYLIDEGDHEQMIETKENGTFKHTINSEDLGMGTHLITVKFHQKVYKQTITISEEAGNQSSGSGSGSRGSSGKKSSSSDNETGTSIIVEEEQIPEAGLNLKNIIRSSETSLEEAEKLVLNLVKNINQGGEMRGQVKAVIKSLMEKSGYVSYNKASVEVSLADAKQELEKSIETAKKLTQQLSENQLSSEAGTIRPLIHLKVTGDDDAYEVNLQTDLVAELKDSKAGVKIDLPTLSFSVSGDLIKELGSDNLTVKAEPLHDQKLENLKGRRTDSGLDVDIVSDVMDIEFKSGDKDVSIGVEKPELTMNVEKMVEMLKTESHMLSVFVYNDENNAWENVPSKIIDGVAKFKAPHFSKYAVLKVNLDFEDIKNHWAEQTIELMSANNIVKGRSATSFSPDENITRAEFAAYLVSAMDLQSPVNGNFNDVSQDAWYYDKVAIAAVNGLVSGVGNGNFAPDQDVSRQDMALMLSKAYDLLNDGVYERPLPASGEFFIDEVHVADYAHDAVIRAKNQGIIEGFADGSFRPMKSATRAEAAQMIRVFWESNILN